MFDPKEIFQIVRNSTKRGTDDQLMSALTQLAEAHPELSSEQALAALQMYTQQEQGKLSNYLEKGGER